MVNQSLEMSPTLTPIKVIVASVLRVTTVLLPEVAAL
jgi:hypothetical protein